MNSIFLTGASGFVGTNFLKYLSNEINVVKYNRGELFQLNQNSVIHLAGKAHDLKNISSPDEYYKVNTDLTIDIFDAFLKSNSKVFITLSSVKAVADRVNGELTEEVLPHPITHYGKSKLLAEQYILSKLIPKGKRVYILRPCMIHGPGNKGNLNLLYRLVSKGIPWPLGAFDNSRSFLSIENLCFVIKELIQNEEIPSGIYNVADDIPLSTNELIQLIAETNSKKARILKINKFLITTLVCLGDLLKLPVTSERLKKLTESYIVNNAKITKALNKQLPISSKEGLEKTFKSFNNNF